MGVSPTKTGEMREDQYWLLKSKRSWVYRDKEGFFVEPVTSEKCSLDQYLCSVQLQQIANIHGERIHGRRVNDEVELFEGDEGKELPGLRESMERQGLTVRTYAPEDPAKKMKKFPKLSYRAMMGEQADHPFTPVERCVYSLKQGIKKLSGDVATVINYALITDANSAKPGFLLFTISADQFYTDSYGDLNTLTSREVKFPVLAVLEGGEVRLNCKEDKFMSYFTAKKDGDYHVELGHHDLREDLERETMEAAKAEKKKAKKHKRQMTQSTVTSPSELSFVSAASQSAEDDEAVKARQRAKNREKKKAQKERRKAKKDDNKEVQNGASDDSQKTSNGDKSAKPIVHGVVGTSVLVTDEHGIMRLVPRRKQIADVALHVRNSSHSDEDDIPKKRQKRAMLRRVSSSSSESDASSTIEAIDGLEVLNLENEKDKKKAIKRIHEGRGNILVAGAPEDEEEVKVLETGLKYVGRGL